MKPRLGSLHGRTVALLAGAILSAVLLTLLTTGGYLRGLWLQQGADWAAAAVLASEAPAGADPARDDARVLLEHSAGPPPAPGLPRLLRRFHRALEEKLGQPVDLRLQSTPGRRLWVRREGASDWTLLPMDAFDPRWPFPGALLLVLGLIAVLILALAGRYTRMLLLPVQSLRAAMDADARSPPGRPPQPVPPSGPEELRALIDGYNALRAGRHAAEQQRAVMLAGLPHDLRAPLTRLRLRATLIEDEETRSALLRDLDTLQSISQQFLDYLRGLDGAAPDCAPLGLAAWLDERAALYRQAGDEVRVDASGIAGSDRVLAHAPTLGRILDNLVGNAIRHGRPPVVLAWTPAPGRVLLSVEDHGEGIPESQRAAALTPFVQLDTARRHGGVGLGLAISQLLATQMGAELRLGVSPAGGLQVVLALRAA